MTAQFNSLMEKLRSIESEIEAELTKRREELRFRLENRRIVFEQEVLRVHRAIKVRATRYFIDANPLIVLSAPVIYSLIVPIALADVWVMAYQAICFPIYKIPMVSRRDYLVFDRHHLAYLNIIEKSIAPTAPIATARSRSSAKWPRAPKSTGARSSMPAACWVRIRTIRDSRISATSRDFAKGLSG
jgi:hypothetical protein